MAESLRELQQQFKQATNAGILILTRQNAVALNLLTWLAALPEEQLILTNVADPLIDDIAETLTLTGVTTTSLEPPFHAQPVVLTRASLVYTLAGSAFTAALTLEGAITIGAHTLQLRGVLGDNTRLDFTLHQSAAAIALTDVIEYVTESQLTPYLPGTLLDLETIPLSNLTLSFGYRRSVPTQISFTSDTTAEWAFMTDFARVRNLGVTMTTRYAVSDSLKVRLQFGGEIHGILHLGQDYSVRIGLAPGNHWEVEVVPADGNLLPGLNDLAALIGNEALKAEVESGLQALQLDAVAIDAVRIGFDLAAKKLTVLTVNAHLTLDGINFFTQITLPRFQFTGRLDTRTPIALNTLIAGYFGQTDLFPTIVLSQLEVAAQPSQASYSLSAAIYDDWTLTVAEMAFQFQSLDFTIARHAGAVTGEMRGLFVWEGVDFDVLVQYTGDGWHFSAQSQNEQALNLTEIVNKLLATFDITLPSAVPDIMLSHLLLSFTTGADAAPTFHFRGETALNAQSDVPLGNKIYKVHTLIDITIDSDPITKKRIFTGFLEGDLQMGSATFQLQYAMAKEAHVFTAFWQSQAGETLGFKEIAAALDIVHEVELPDGLEVQLTRAVFEYHVEKATFILAADANHGQAFFVAGKPAPEASWGFVFGVEFAGFRLSDLPVVGADLHAADFLHFKELGLLLSSQAWQRLQLPQFPAPDPMNSQQRRQGSPAAPTIGDLSGTTLNLAQGLSAIAVLDFTQSQAPDARLSNLHTLVGQAELIMQATIAQNELTLSAILRGGVTVRGSGDAAVGLANVRINLEIEPTFKVELFGSTFVAIGADTLEAVGGMVISLTEAQCIFEIKAERAGQPADLPLPVGLQGVRLSELGVEMGVVFEPPAVDLGLMGKFNLITQAVGANEFALILGLEGELPNLLLLYVFFEELTVENVVIAFTGEPDTHVPALIQQIEASALSLYWAESALELPDGTSASGGFGFNGFVQIGPFIGHARLTMSKATGIAGDAELAPINWRDVVTLTGRGQGVTITEEEVNGIWQPKGKRLLATGADSQSSIYPTRQRQVIPPGGAFILFNSQQAPYLDVSADLMVFNLLHTAVDITVTDKGFTFQLQASIGQTAHVEVDCEIDDNHFHGYAEFDLDIKGDIGPIIILDVNFGTIHLDVGFAVKLDITVNRDGFYVLVNGAFWFDDYHLTMPELQITADFHSLEQLPEKILEQIENEAETIFKEVFDFVEKLWQDTKAEAEQLVTSAEQEAVQLLADAERAAITIEHEAEQVFTTIREDAGKIVAEAEKIEQEAEQILADAGHEAAAIVHEAEQYAAQVEQEAEQIFHEAVAEAEQIVNAAEQEAQRLIQEADQLFHKAEQEAAALLAAAETEVAQILNTARRVANTILDEAREIAAEIEAEAERIWDAIAEAARSVVHTIGHAVKDAWNHIKKY